jgi:ankyrin repeat protein
LRTIFCVSTGNAWFAGLATVAALLNLGANVNAQVNEVTPLMIAADEGNLCVVQLLIDAGANPRAQAGRFTAADYARYRGHDALADRLIQALAAAES